MMRAYTFFAMAVLGLYGVASWRGWDIGSSRRGLIPASVRQQPGGYRSFVFWRGGK